MHFSELLYAYKLNNSDLSFIIQAAHKLGMKVMLKPHIDLESNGEHSNPWFFLFFLKNIIWRRGNIGGFNETELIEWFKSY